MEEILIIFAGIIFFKRIIKAVGSFIKLLINILILLILKKNLNLDLDVLIVSLLCFKIMYKYIKAKLKESKRKYNRPRYNVENIKLRKLSRFLLECNYIVFIFGCFIFILNTLLKQALWYSLDIIFKIYIILIVANIIKKGIDAIPERFYA